MPEAEAIVENVRDMIANVEDASTASMAYAVGDYFIYNDKLYKATAAIASGGTITPNTNCVEAVLGNDVSALKSAYDDMAKPVSLVAPDLMLDGKYYNNDSLVDETPPYYMSYITAYIPVEANKTYYIYNKETESAYNDIQIALYDKDYNYLGFVKRVSSFTTTRATAYIRYSCLTEYKNRIAILSDNIYEDSTPYGTKEIKKSYLQPFADDVDKINTINKPIVISESSFDSSTPLAYSAPNLKQKEISFTAICTTQGDIIISNGLSQPYASGIITITNTDITVLRYTNATVVMFNEQHNLDLSKFIDITIIQKANLTCDILLTGVDGVKKYTDVYFEGSYSDIKVTTTGEYTDAKLTVYCKQYNCDIWAFGDSYFDLWVPEAYGNGAKNACFDAFSGRTSQQALISLQKSLLVYSPKIILWCMGMNNGDDSNHINYDWLKAYISLENICYENNIELVLATIPNTPTISNSYKNTKIRNSGYRYVDICKAVGADISNNWYAGLLSTDNVHPTPLGRKVIANYVISSMPELLDI